MVKPNKSKLSTESIEIPLLDRLVFYFTVSITGAAVMMIELMGTRIIGPFFGVSLVVWSSLLSVALLALAFGYFWGGRFADRLPWLRLSHIILAAAVWIGAIPWLSEPVQLLMNSLGLRLGALGSAFVLFTFPLFMLGMVGPYVIKIATRRLDVIGSTVGNVYAMSTLGSVIGTLLLGFYLLPLAGVELIILCLSATLIGLSLLLFLYESKYLTQVENIPLKASVAFFILALITLFSSVLKPEKQYLGYEVLFDKEGRYGWVRVVDKKDENLRYLLADASTIGAESLITGQPMLSYQEIVKLVTAFNRDGRDLLLVGLGSGHLVTSLAEEGIRTDAIEIDPLVVEAAEKFFNYQPTGETIVGDARYQIKKIKKKYDFIVHDCFTGGAEPVHLLSREMITELKSMLKPGGVLAINFVGFNKKQKDNPVKSVAYTIDQVFKHRKSFVSVPNAEWNDFIFFASDAALELGNATKQDVVAQATLRKHEIYINGYGGRIITDDYNPMETMQIAKAEYYREILVDRLGQDILFR